MVEQVPLDYFEEHEKGHGRHSHWYIRVFDLSLSPYAKQWRALRRFIHVHKHTVTKNRDCHSDRLYITDHYHNDAKTYHDGIRGHWKIENALHWVKDVIHKEDHNRLKKDNAPVNAAVFSSIAINVHRKNGNYSITDGQIKFGTNVKELFKFIRT